jgi:phage terminase Nu1 subunit (DNA packaging protein)
MSISMTKKELANVAGYTYRRLYDIDKDLPDGKKLFEQSEGGKYDLAIFVQRWVEYNVSHSADTDVYDLEEVKAKHEVIKAEKTQLEVDKMRGQLIDVQDVRRLWGNIANTVMQNMIHLPSKLAPMLQMMDNIELIKDIIDTEIRKILNEIADTPLPDYAAEGESEESEDEDGEV